MSISKIWVEKYRPKSVSDVIMTSDVYRRKFDSFVERGEIPNMLLIGGPGTGKTSVSSALVRDLNIDRSDRLRINCSNEKIDAVRSKVEGFAMTMPIGKFKIVQLEEFDNIGVDAQRLLRDLIETSSETTRFIATCNYANLLIPPIRSRFSEFYFTSPSLDEVTVRAAEILMAEDVEFDIETLETIIALAFPDFRKVIQLLESGVVDGKLTVDRESDIIADWKPKLLEHFAQQDLDGARKMICASASKDELVEVYRFLYNNIHKMGFTGDKLGEAYVLLAQYQFQHSFVQDPELQIAALFIKLSLLG